MAPVLERKSNGSYEKTVLKGELLIWRTKNQARDQGTVQLKHSICFKSIQIGSYKIKTKSFREIEGALLALLKSCPQ
jgi:hypothetical protein